MNRVLVLLAASVALAVQVACGITPERDARSVEPPPGPYQALASQAPQVVESGTAEQTLFLVREGRLVPVVRSVHGPPTLDALMRDLLAGPTDAERADGLSSALPGADVIGQVWLTDGYATVELAVGPEGSGRSDEVLAFGQVVCTLDARPDVTGVIFVRAGQPVGVPRGDASLSLGPLTTADYTNLITEE